MTEEKDEVFIANFIPGGLQPWTACESVEALLGKLWNHYSGSWQVKPIFRIEKWKYEEVVVNEKNSSDIWKETARACVRDCGWESVATILIEKTSPK